MFKEACMFLLRKLHRHLQVWHPALAGIVGGRPKASAVVKLFSFLIDKDQIKVEVDFAGQRHPVQIATGLAPQDINLHPVGEVGNLSR